MKRLLSIIFAITYISGIFAPFYTYAGYLLHKEYIVENLCVNQAKPEMDCEGKCYIKTQIIKEVTQNTDTKSTLPSTNNTNFYTPHYVVPNQEIALVQKSFELQNLAFIIISGADYSYNNYSPPEFSV